MPFVPPSPDTLVEDTPAVGRKFVPPPPEALVDSAVPLQNRAAPGTMAPGFKLGRFAPSPEPKPTMEEFQTPNIELPSVAEIGQHLYPGSPAVGTLLQGALNSSVPLSVIDEIWNQVKSLPEFFSSGQGVATGMGGAVAPNAVSAGYGGILGKQFVDQLAEQIVNYPQQTWAERAREMVKTLGPAALFGMAAHPAVSAVGEVGPKIDLRPQETPKTPTTPLLPARQRAEARGQGEQPVAVPPPTTIVPPVAAPGVPAHAPAQKQPRTQAEIDALRLQQQGLLPAVEQEPVAAPAPVAEPAPRAFVPPPPESLVEEPAPQPSVTPTVPYTPPPDYHAQRGPLELPPIGEQTNEQTIRSSEGTPGVPRLQQEIGQEKRGDVAPGALAEGGEERKVLGPETSVPYEQRKQWQQQLDDLEIAGKYFTPEAKLLRDKIAGSEIEPLNKTPEAQSVKQPWQMTKDEWLDTQPNTLHGREMDRFQKEGIFGSGYRNMLLRAYQAGMKVDPDLLDSVGLHAQAKRLRPAKGPETAAPRGEADELNQLRALPERTPEQQARLDELTAKDATQKGREEWQRRWQEERAAGAAEPKQEMGASRTLNIRGGERKLEHQHELTLMRTILGSRPFDKTPMGNYPSASLDRMSIPDMDALYKRLAQRVDVLRKQLHPDVGGDTEQVAKLNAAWAELQKRFRREADTRGITLAKTEKGPLAVTEPVHEPVYKEPKQQALAESKSQEKIAARPSEKQVFYDEDAAHEFTDAQRESTGKEWLVQQEGSHWRVEEYKGPETVAPSAEETVRRSHPYWKMSETARRELKAMGLAETGESWAAKMAEGRPLNEVIANIAKNGKVLGENNAALARWMEDNAEHILPLYKVSFEDKIDYGRAWHEPYNREVHLPLTDQLNPVVDTLHEAAHAIIHWQIVNPNTPVQHAVRARLLDIMEVAKEKMPEEVRKFYDTVYRPFVAKGDRSTKAMNTLSDGIRALPQPELWNSVFHAMSSGPHELAAQILRSKTTAVADWLNSWEYKSKTALQAIWDSIKELFGAKPGTALDSALEGIQAVLDERVRKEEDAPMEGTVLGNLAWRGGEWVKNVGPNLAPMALIENAGKVPSTATPMPGRPPSIKDADFRERMRVVANRIAGYSLPHLSSADQETANAGVRYASSRIAAPLVARHLASQVLGRQFKNGAYDRLVGDVVIEDRLRAIKQGWLDAAAKEKDPSKKAEYAATAADVRSVIGDPNHALRTEKQYQMLLKDPTMVETLDRHKRILQPLAESQHVATGGSLARPGEQTGAFVNLMAILAPDDVEGTQSMIYGSRRGDITNPLRRGSTFSKTAKGTAEVYERSYRTLAERMIRGNYEQAALREFYTKLEEKNLAVEDKPGVAPPSTLGGKPTRKITIEIRGGGPGMTRQRNLWVRSDLYDEVRHALAVDDPLIRNSALRSLAQAATEMQIVGATDAVYHTMNMAAAIVTAQGGKNVWADLARKVPGVNLIDAIARVTHQGIRVAMDSIDVQRDLATIAEAGAGRAEPVHTSLVTKGAQALVGEKGKYADPSFYSSRFIKLVDKAGRLSLNRMYENLVDRGLAEDSTEARREFINRMGQYNERLMPRLDATLRAASLSSFIVAGKNFNRLAMGRFLMDPGVRAASPEAWWKMRAIEALGAGITVGLTSYVVNKYLTGTPMGRPGTPAGAIDTGKNDEQGRPIIIDPLQTTLWRRALRISGLQAGVRGYEEKLPGREVRKEVLSDIFQGLIHPYAGPSVRAAKMAVTGYDTSGYLVSRNPDDPFENAYAALKNGNPMVAAYLRGKEAVEGGASAGEKRKGGLAALGQSLEAATGFGKRGRHPTVEQEMEGKLGKPMESASLGDRRTAAKEVFTERKAGPPQDPLAKRAMALKNEMRQFAEQDALRERVAPEVRAFLDKNGLQLPAFREEITSGRVKVPLTRDEQKRYEDLVVDEYNKRISAFIPYLPEDRAKRQEALNKRLDMARKHARSRMKASLVGTE